MELSSSIEDQIQTLLNEEGKECISIVDPETLKNNIASFRNVLSTYRFKSQIHYVMKVNESWILIQTTREAWCRVDVSSYGELIRALELGYTGDTITANWPKNKKFIRKCIEVWCIIAIDNLSELRFINSLDKPSKLLIRLGGVRCKTKYSLLSTEGNLARTIWWIGKTQWLCWSYWCELSCWYDRCKMENKNLLGSYRIHTRTLARAKKKNKNYQYRVILLSILYWR